MSKVFGKSPAVDIDALLQDSYLLVVELQNKAAAQDGEELWKLCVAQVEQCRNSLIEADVSQRSVNQICYAQCALLDETVLRNALDKAHAVWAAKPLQAHFFSRHQAGEQLYEDMREALAEPAPDLRVLTCYHRVLLLGFLGRYRTEAAPEREQLLAALGEHVEPFSAAAAGQFRQGQLAPLAQPALAARGSCCGAAGWPLAGIAPSTCGYRHVAVVWPGVTMATQLRGTRGLWLWAGLLGLALTLAILPLSVRAQVSWTLAIVCLVALGWFFSGIAAARQRRSLVLAGEHALPADAFRKPVVAVCGDGLYSLFGAAPENQLALRVTEQGCYLRVPSPDRLPMIIDYVLANRPHWAAQLAVLYIANPAEQTDSAQLAGAIQTFRHQVARIRRSGVALPILLGSYLPSQRDDGRWFAWEAGQPGLSVREGASHLSVAQWQQRAVDLLDSAARLRTCVQIESLGRWLTTSVLPHLVSRDSRDAPCPATACAMTLAPGSTLIASGNLWSQWLHDRTALEMAAPAAGSAQLPFPDPLLSLLPRQASLTPARRAAVRGLWLFVLAAAIALCSSAWQNRLLLRQVSDDLQRYRAIPEPATLEQPEHVLREQAVSVLREDAAKLDRYYREGEPLALGFGLYSAERIRPPILAALAAHRVPMPKPLPAKIPDPVRLDSLSLFASGSAELKPGSTKVLINALVDIKAQPGWLIVIAGHTDATGDSQRNLLLSRARAGAVRDWMQRMGDIPDSCFAVQGFGSDQPLDSNDTPEGRAANRRVDIRLVPESGACALPTQVSGGQPQPRQKPAAHLSL